MIYQRAHISQCARHFAPALAVALLVSSLIFLSRALADVAASAWPASAIGRLLVLQMIKYAPQILTASLATGVLLAAARAYHNREMAAWFSAGLGARKFILPTAAFAAPVCLAVLTAALWLSPWAVRATDSLTASLRNEFDPQSAAPNQFRILPGGEYVYFWDKDAARVFIAAAGEGADYHAALAGGASKGEGDGLLLREGRGYRLAPGKNGGADFWEEMRFDSWRLSAPPAEARTRRISAAPAGDLRWNNPRERADLAKRLLLPANAFFLALLALFAAHSRPTMGARQGFGVGVMLFLLNLNLLYFAAEQMEREGLSFAAAALLPPAATFAAAALLKSGARR